MAKVLKNDGRKGFFLICDDFSVSLNGKYNLRGVYTGDINIPSSIAQAQQLSFLVVIETLREKPFRSLSVSISFPGQEPKIIDAMKNMVSIANFDMAPKERTRLSLKLPILVNGPILRKGKIEVKAIHEEGEMSLGSTWIETAEQPAISNPSDASSPPPLRSPPSGPAS